ncbi:MAG: ArsA-related P-loop ATPase [Bdellovibrionota bacterium]
MKQSVVVLGSGGVGKTTVAAAMGLAMAQKYSRGAIFTVDPSQRLCQTLGLKHLSLEPSLMCEGRVEVYGLEIQDALKKLLVKVIHDPKKVETILNHRLFRMIEGNVSHLDHFLAMEKIVELIKREDLDFLVVDTPPHDQAFEFFEAPKVLSSFLDKAFLKILMDPKISSDNLVARVVNKAMDEGWKIFRSFMGDSFWQELATLLEELMPLRDKLLSATESMNAFLHASNTQAALVCVPERASLAVAEELNQNWKSKLNLEVKDLVFNRAQPADLKMQQELKGTLFYEKFELQKQLYASEFFKSFERVALIHPRSPRDMGLKVLEEIGHDLVEKFNFESKV